MAQNKRHTWDGISAHDQGILDHYEEWLEGKWKPHWSDDEQILTSYHESLTRKRPEPGAKLDREQILIKALMDIYHEARNKPHCVYLSEIAMDALTEAGLIYFPEIDLWTGPRLKKEDK